MIAKCPFCDNEFGGYADVALEFVLPNNTSVFVKAKCSVDQLEGWFALFKVVGGDGPDHWTEEAVPSSLLRFPRNGPILRYVDYVHQNTVSPRELGDGKKSGGAIAARVYCFGETSEFNMVTDLKGNIVESESESDWKPRRCLPKGAVLEALTEDHLQQIRFVAARRV